MEKELRVGQPVWEIRINNVQGTYKSTIEAHKPGIHVTRHSILGISKWKICLDDEWFTTFDNPNKSFKTTELNGINISIKTKEDYFPNGVFIQMYSTNKPSKTILNKMALHAEKTIKKEYGVLMGGVGSQIKDMIKSFKLPTK